MPTTTDDKYSTKMAQVLENHDLLLLTLTHSEAVVICAAAQVCHAWAIAARAVPLCCACGRSARDGCKFGHACVADTAPSGALTPEVAAVEDFHVCTDCSHVFCTGCASNPCCISHCRVCGGTTMCHICDETSAVATESIWCACCCVQCTECGQHVCPSHASASGHAASVDKRSAKQCVECRDRAYEAFMFARVHPGLNEGVVGALSEPQPIL